MPPRWCVIALGILVGAFDRIQAPAAGPGQSDDLGRRVRRLYEHGHCQAASRRPASTASTPARPTSTWRAMRCRRSASCMAGFLIKATGWTLCRPADVRADCRVYFIFVVGHYRRSDQYPHGRHARRAWKWKRLPPPSSSTPPGLATCMTCTFGPSATACTSLSCHIILPSDCTVSESQSIIAGAKRAPA